MPAKKGWIISLNIFEFWNLEKGMKQGRSSHKTY